MQQKAIIFTRVSSRAQQDEGYSLESQIKLLRGYCSDKGYKVMKEYKIAETASKQERRTLFSGIITQIMKDKVDHFVVEKTDRLTRNMKDAASLDDWLDGDERRMLHIVKENLLLHKNARSDAKFMWNIHLSVAKKYTDNLREEAMKGWAEKLAQGWLPSPPPPGYITVAEGKRKIHALDPNTDKLIERAFRLKLLPGGTIKSVTEDMATMGLVTRSGRPYTRSSVHRILTNPFYIGINRHNGKEYPGAQEPLISRELFYAVQDNLCHGRPSNARKHDPIFKCMITCSVAVPW